MKILITNNDLSMRSGSELYAKEVAEELMKRGHTVAAYSSRIGELAKTMNRAGIQTVDDLSELSWIPDIIHGQHHLEAMAALAHFPNVPAVYVCHGWRPWQEKPPAHPRILQYLAVDLATLDLAVQKNGILRDQIRLIHNFADLDRFKQREPLPEKPKKALVFNNEANENNYLQLVRQACQKAGVELEAIGMASGHSSNQPEKMLKNYDLVFAVGRSAVEALATGAAVVICSDFGVGPMVSLRDMDRLRDLNFGVAAMNSKPSADEIYKEICKYSAEDSAKLTKRLRAVIDIEPAVDELEQFYKIVLEKHKTINISTESEAHAMARYLKNIATFIKHEFEQKDQEVRQKDLEVKQKNWEISWLKSSKFWKIREKYMAVKKNIFRI